MTVNFARFSCLMYHNVVRPEAVLTDLSPSITRYFVSEAQFAAQLELLAAHARVITLDDVLAAVNVGQRSSQQSHDNRLLASMSSAEQATPRHAVHLTFDDGWLGSFDVAGPLLTARGMEATVFVTTAFIGTPRFATAHDLRQAAQSGHFRIGAHGVTHRLLGELSAAAAADELQTSRRKLEDLLGQPVTTCALPGGSGDSRTLQLARDAGYEAVFTSQVGLNVTNRQGTTVRRAAILSTTDNRVLQNWVTGSYWRDHVRQWALTAPKRLLGRAGYARLRRTLVGEQRGQREMTDLPQNGASPASAPVLS